MNLYTYVIMTDRGSAPNYEPPFTTLAICKPKIRKGAQVGDAVLAYTGSSMSPEPHAVCWAGVIKEKLTFEEYWDDARFQEKKPEKSGTPDNIYYPVNGGLLQVPNSSHGTDAFTRDTNGQFVLVFDPCWYFGSGGPVKPANFDLRMTAGRRAHRKHELHVQQWDQLKTWLDANTSKTIMLPPLVDKNAKGTSRTPPKGCI